MKPYICTLHPLHPEVVCGPTSTWSECDDNEASLTETVASTSKPKPGLQQRGRPCCPWFMHPSANTCRRLYPLLCIIQHKLFSSGRLFGLLSLLLRLESELAVRSEHLYPYIRCRVFVQSLSTCAGMEIWGQLWCAGFFRVSGGYQEAKGRRELSWEIDSDLFWVGKIG